MNLFIIFLSVPSIKTFDQVPLTIFSKLRPFPQVKYPVAPPDAPVLQAPDKHFGALLAADTPLYSDWQQEMEKEELEQLLQGEVFLRPSYFEVVQEPPEVVTAHRVFHVAPVIAAFTENVSYPVSVYEFIHSFFYSPGDLLLFFFAIIHIFKGTRYMVFIK